MQSSGSGRLPLERWAWSIGPHARTRHWPRGRSVPMQVPGTVAWMLRRDAVRRNAVVGGVGWRCSTHRVRGPVASRPPGPAGGGLDTTRRGWPGRSGPHAASAAGGGLRTRPAAGHRKGTHSRRRGRQGRRVGRAGRLGWPGPPPAADSVPHPAPGAAGWPRPAAALPIRLPRAGHRPPRSRRHPGRGRRQGRGLDGWGVGWRLTTTRVTVPSQARRRHASGASGPAQPTWPPTPPERLSRLSSSTVTSSWGRTPPACGNRPPSNARRANSANASAVRWPPLRVSWASAGRGQGFLLYRTVELVPCRRRHHSRGARPCIGGPRSGRRQPG
jgi:hypothetical protein